MIPELRAQFNERFTPEKYQRFLRLLDQGAGRTSSFAIAKRRCFFRATLFDRMACDGADLIRQLMTSEYRARPSRPCPRIIACPTKMRSPLFVQVDFGLTADLEPKLVEIQAFPSLYAYQPFLQRRYRDAYELDLALRCRLTTADFAAPSLGDHAPENVVLLEIDPQHQKTLPDFLLTEKTARYPDRLHHRQSRSAATDCSTAACRSSASTTA